MLFSNNFTCADYYRLVIGVHNQLLRLKGGILHDEVKAVGIP
jgi:hypothetical protein